MKRLDLIFSERELDAILEALEAADVPGYTVMKHATGKGPQTKSDRERYRKIADDLFLCGMQHAEPAVPKWKIYSAYYAVRMFGRWAINGSAPRG